MDFIFDLSLLLYLPLYLMDDASIMDRSAYGHLCTVTGAVWTPRGRKFDGTDDKIALPSAVYQAFANTDDFTYEVWAYTDGVADGFPIGSRGINPNHAPAIWIYFSVNTIQALVRRTSVSPVQSNSVTASGIGVGWHHAILRWRASEHAVYLNVDGVAIGSDATYALTFAKADFGEGYVGLISTAYWDGYVGEVRIYRRFLSLLEIQHNYLATKWRYQ